MYCSLIKVLLKFILQSSPNYNSATKEHRYAEVCISNVAKYIYIKIIVFIIIIIIIIVQPLKKIFIVQALPSHIQGVVQISDQIRNFIMYSSSIIWDLWQSPSVIPPFQNIKTYYILYQGYLVLLVYIMKEHNLYRGYNLIDFNLGSG